MTDNQKLEELRISIESKMENLSSTIREYEELDGQVNYLSMLYFSGEEDIKASLIGNADELGDMLLSNEDLQSIMLRRVIQSRMEEEE